MADEAVTDEAVADGAVTEPASTGRSTTRDRAYGPTLLAGVLGAGLLAVAGHRDWIDVETTAAQEGTVAIFRDANPGLAQVPLAGALGLVALACWGVLLVLRGVWRRAAAGLGVLAGIGAVVAWAQGLASLEDDVRAKVETTGMGGAWDLVWTPWFALALMGALLTTLASVVAVWRVPRWPAMGARYDAPAVRAASEAERAAGAGAGGAAAGDVAADLSEADPTDVWKAIDAGQDPT